MAQIDGCFGQKNDSGSLAFKKSRRMLIASRKERMKAGKDAYEAGDVMLALECFERAVTVPARDSFMLFDPPFVDGLMLLRKLETEIHSAMAVAAQEEAEAAEIHARAALEAAQAAADHQSAAEDLDGAQTAVAMTEAALAKAKNKK